MESLEIKGEKFTNKGEIEGRNLVFEPLPEINLASLSSALSSLESSTLENEGSLKSDLKTSFRNLGTFHNKKLVESKGEIEIQGQIFENGAEGRCTAHFLQGKSDIFKNRGTLEARRRLEEKVLFKWFLKEGNNTALIKSEGSLELSIEKSFSHGEPPPESQTSHLYAKEEVLLKGPGSFLNESLLTSENRILLKKIRILNKGRFFAPFIRGSFDGLINEGLFMAEKQIFFKLQHNLLNRKKGGLDSKEELTVRVKDDLENLGKISGDKNVDL